MQWFNQQMFKELLTFPMNSVKYSVLIRQTNHDLSSISPKAKVIIVNRICKSQNSFFL